MSAGGMQHGGTLSQAAAAAGGPSSALGVAGGTLSEGVLGTPKNPLIMSFVSQA